MRSWPFQMLVIFCRVLRRSTTSRRRAAGNQGVPHLLVVGFWSQPWWFGLNSSWKSLSEHYHWFNWLLPLQERDPEFYRFLVEEVTQKCKLAYLSTFMRSIQLLHDDNQSLPKLVIMSWYVMPMLMWAWPVSTRQDQKLLDFTADVEGESDEDRSAVLKFALSLPLQRFFPQLWHFLPFHVVRALNFERYWLISCLVWTAFDTSIKLLELSAFFYGLSGKQVWRRGTGLV